MSAALWSPLLRELDLWQEAGRRLRLWLRDDDAVAPSAALDRLAACAERFGAPVLLAVIPLLAEPALAGALRGKPVLLPCQHGCRHRNHAPAGAKKSEFGPDRAPQEVDAGIAGAWLRLRDLLGESVLPVFVPPWNRIDPGHAARLPALGFAGLSCFRDHRHGPAGGPHLLNTHIDVMDWHGGRVGRSHGELIAEIAGLLARWRTRPRGPDTLGLLLHHRDHDAVAWAFLDGLLARAAAHPAVALTDPRDLLRPENPP
ncbi:polysaccharide deacetylase family protein [Bosea minatitlanensis]|uniref:Polysaccharide deacetylase family protein n=1 Tax=Bosea minatitlanensis TaxID=128782 RepID=A0ABW0F4J6_9HYPH|nr:polysaccharide deacetylase family protein [Bosea minatitlanensis]MCT4494113.1 polysaccharide deacetylase family protein [Bosea minatitlanensis]